MVDTVIEATALLPRKSRSRRFEGVPRTGQVKEANRRSCQQLLEGNG